MADLTKFRKELTYLINSNSMENGSDTPDFILAEYMTDCLIAYDKATLRRSDWYDAALSDNEIVKVPLDIPIKSSGINYVVGDVTNPIGDDKRIIVHVCNDIGAWGAGFVLALSKKWPGVEAAYRKSFKSDTPPVLGDVGFVKAEDEIYVINLIGQHRIKKSQDGKPPIRYDAIQSGLQKIANAIHDANDKGHQFSVHLPKIGAGLAGGDWKRIAKIIKEELVDKGIDVTVYELPNEIEYADPEPVEPLVINADGLPSQGLFTDIPEVNFGGLRLSPDDINNKL